MFDLINSEKNQSTIKLGIKHNKKALTILYYFFETIKG
jgi:hypothetical protein